MARNLLLLAVSSLMTIASQANDMSLIHKEWKILKNQYGWSVQYPSNWKLVEIGDLPPSADTSVEINGPERELKLKHQAADLIIRPEFSIDNTSDLKSIIQKYYNGGDHQTDPNVKFVDGRETIVGGNKSYEMNIQIKPSHQYPLGAVIRHIIIKHPDIPISIVLGPNKTMKYCLISLVYSEGTTKKVAPKNNWKYEKIFNEMLSTFKFSDQEKNKK